MTLRDERARDNGFANYAQYQRMVHLANHPETRGFIPRSDMAEYHPERAIEIGMSLHDYTKAYLDAWVTGKGRYEANRADGSDALEYWFTEILGDEDFYDEKYKSD